MKPINIIKQHLEDIVNAVSAAITPCGPGVIAIVINNIVGDQINISVYEMSTELVGGPLDGSEIFYGFSCNIDNFNAAISIDNTSFINNDDGVSLVVSGTTHASPIKSIIINILGDPELDTPVGQIYNTISNEYAPYKPSENIIAIIKGRKDSI